ncbi:MAG TPA: LCP family protein, partial [Actinomycetota bacterium]|nr:LCP family protein [Actinomycetota bacterium]
MPSPQRSLADLIKPGMVHPGRRTRRLGVRILIGLLLVAVLGVLATAGLYFLGGPKASHVKGLGELPAGEPMNVLVLGSDSREGLSKEELRKYDPQGTDRRSGRRSDTIMLLHVDPDKEKVVMVSFPRDLRIRHPNGSLGRINAIYQQGPSAMVQAVKTYTGLPIHHYVEVNFEGFKNIVDTVGGVDVFFERSIREPDSGLNVRKGCVHLVGDQALAFVRVRKIDSDFGRIARQQLFLRLMMDKVTHAKILINPVKIVKLVEILSNNVTTDTGLSLGDLKGLALQLRGFDQSRIDM